MPPEPDVLPCDSALRSGGYEGRHSQLRELGRDLVDLLVQQVDAGHFEVPIAQLHRAETRDLVGAVADVEVQLTPEVGGDDHVDGSHAGPLVVQYEHDLLLLPGRDGWGH
jgi:hypothetical protein